MKNFLIIALFSIFCFSIVSTTDSCQSTIENFSCEFYILCLENTYHCGADGYPVGYGYKYCNKFTEHMSEFSESGQKWIEGTLVCLKKALLPLIDQNTTTCQLIHNAAFDSHPKCYVSNGFCELFLDPLHILQNVRGLLSVYEIKDMAQPISFKQILQTVGLCGVDVVRKFYDAVAKIIAENN